MKRRSFLATVAGILGFRIPPKNTIIGIAGTPQETVGPIIKLNDLPLPIVHSDFWYGAPLDKSEWIALDESVMNQVERQMRTWREM